MDLLRSCAGFTSWFYFLLRKLMLANRSAVVGLICRTALSQFVSVLVFLVPLKLVLLISSDGVPRYFQFFVSQETRDGWILGLSVAIFVFYVWLIRLNNKAEDDAKRSAESLLAAYDDVPLLNDPQRLAKQTVDRIGSVSGGFIFVFITLILGGIVFPIIFIWITAIITLEFFLTAAAVNVRRPGAVSRYASFVLSQPQSLFQFLRQINFLLVFALILLMYLVFGGINALLAIASIMLSRQIFGALATVGRDGVKLNADRRLLNLLLHPTAQAALEVPTDRETLLRNAHPSQRLHNYRTLLARSSPADWRSTASDDPSDMALLDSVTEIVWIDSGKPRGGIFDLYGPGAAISHERLLRHYVYVGKARQQLNQQDILMEHLPTQALRCPRRVFSYESEALAGRIVDFQGVRELTPGERGKSRRELLAYLWCLRLPEDLTNLARKTQLPLHERLLNDQFLRALQVAADQPWADSAYSLLEDRLSLLCETVSELPLRLHNRNLNRQNIAIGPDGNAICLTWTSWSVEPLGCGFAPDQDGRMLFEAIERSVDGGSGPSSVSVADAIVAAVLHRMEFLVQSGYPKKALAVAASTSGFLINPQASDLKAMFKSSGQRKLQT